MRDTRRNAIAIAEATEIPLRQWNPCVGRIAASSRAGEVFVECAGSSPVPARLLEGIDRVALSRSDSVGREVLLVFDGGDPGKPIVVGLLENRIESLVRMEAPDESLGAPKEILCDGKRLVVDVSEEIILRCGEGSIMIGKNGKIVLRGTHLLSLSTGRNRIKGGSVSIN
jgi:hypothetical protein